MTKTDDEFFPSSPRTLYRSNPLVEVICQLKFPPLLRIEGSPPAEFQERIRSNFPILRRGPSAPEGVDIPAPLLQLIAATQGAAPYQFLTTDERSVVTLSTDFIGFTTVKYTRWEDFKDDFKEPLAALLDIYQPAFYSRVGLRYVNAIYREDIGLQDCPWAELLAPEIVGELALPNVEQNATLVNRRIELKYPDSSCSVRMQHGFGKVNDRPETCYLIDFDFYNDGRTEVDQTGGILDRFNNRIGRAFRWAISSRLHEALGPTDLG